MGWIGGAIGYFVGSRFGTLGGLAGAVLGSYLGDFLKSKGEEAQAQKTMMDEARARMNARARSSSRAHSPIENEVVFLTAVGAMFAKLSKADGRIDETEIAAGEQAFARLGLTAEKRAFVIRAFRMAKNDNHTIYEYATSFAKAAPARVIRELVYDLLWEIACADGTLSPEERHILELITIPLAIRPALYREEYMRRLGSFQSGRQERTREQTGGSGSGSRRRAAEPERSVDPYDVLGCARSATNDELRRAYRAQAKKHHPDLLRAQGLPEELISKANEKMARINAAWDEIKRERSL